MSRSSKLKYLSAILFVVAAAVVFFVANTLKVYTGWTLLGVAAYVVSLA